ncbi:MAG: flavodoxin domain-containing protein [Candidatus Limnocylindria bacterium]
MVRVLVSVASRHGGTKEIGEAIAAALSEEDIESEVQPPERVATLDGFDAVIVGSGVYAGHWLEVAKHFIERHEGALRQRPVWLFSSGPLGDPLAPIAEPVDVAPLMEMTAARGHRVFAGKLAREELGFGERALVKMVCAPYGDYRNWPEIAAWAREIAGELRTTARLQGRAS